MDTSQITPFWPILRSVVTQLRETFTSDFIHLGYDERNSSLLCLEEGGIAAPDFGVLEEKISEILRASKYNLSNVIRWENEERKVYQDRAGAVTHYHRTNSPQARDPYFVTTSNLLLDVPRDERDGWNLYQEVQNIVNVAEAKPLGVLASVVNLDPKVWKRNNVGPRLLAIAIALSKDGLNESEFRSFFTETCEGMRHPLIRGDCSTFGKLIATSDDSSDNSSSCPVQLVTKAMARPREGILVENGTKTKPMAAEILDALAESEVARTSQAE